MNWLNAFKSSVSSVAAVNTCTNLLRTQIKTRSISNKSFTINYNDFNPRPSFCRLYPSNKSPCFDPKSVTIERGQKCHGRLIRTFLNSEFWPREPCVCGLWIPPDSTYLDILTDRYSYSGDRLLAFERIKRTGERKMIGFCVGYKTYPWMINELEEWAHVTSSRPEKSRMYFYAHCLKSPNFFKRYHVDYVYDVEVLCVAQEAEKHGVASLLLNTMLAHAEDVRHPLVQVVAVNKYIAKICKKCGMKRDWNIDFSEFVDDFGQSVFFPRRPHQSVAIYTQYNNPAYGIKLGCKESF